MRGFTRKAGCVGQRVEIPAYSDLWMRGARFGVVVAVNKPRAMLAPQPTIFAIRMDHPQVRRLAYVLADDCTTLQRSR